MIPQRGPFQASGVRYILQESGKSLGNWRGIRRGYDNYPKLRGQELC